MQQEQELLNKQREIKAETAMGLIYGFGSVAGNKNIEATVMKGESALMKIKNDAVNADSELQNKVIELNDAYQLDARKIEQWKAEEMNSNYEQLQTYLMEIQNDKSMASLEKEERITEAVNNYNEQTGALSATVAQAKYDLSLSLVSRADSLAAQFKQEKRAEAAEARTAEAHELSMESARAQETRTSESFEFEKREMERGRAIEDLNLLMGNYSTSDWGGLPDDVKTKMNEMGKALDMPDSFGQKAFETYRKAQETNETPDFEFYTDNNGRVTAVSYNPNSGQFESVNLGNIDERETGNWKTVKDKDGNPLLYNSDTGSVRLPGEFDSGAKGDPIDALSVPDGAHAGQCGRFVNNYSNIGMGDEFSSKMAKTDPSIVNPEPGDVFVMPYSWTGHTGFVLADEGDYVLVKDSNWGLDEKVQTHRIKKSSISGYARVGNWSDPTAANEENTEGLPDSIQASLLFGSEKEEPDDSPKKTTTPPSSSDDDEDDEDFDW